MKLVIFKNLNEQEKSDGVKRLISESTPSQDFFLMVILSFLTATFGLLLDDNPVLIGSMLIAPMLYPFLSLSLGIVLADGKLISRSFLTIGKSAVFGIFGAIVVTLFASPETEGIVKTTLLTMRPTLAYAVVACISGLAAAFALLKPHLNEAFPGVAISVSLIPPLAACGIGIVELNWRLVRNSFSVFGINAAGIVFMGVLVFSLMNLYIEKNIVKQAVENEDNELKRVEEQVIRDQSV